MKIKMIAMFDKFLAMCFNGMYPICCVGFFGLTSSSPAHRVLDGIFRNGKGLVRRVGKDFLEFLEEKGQVSILVKKASARSLIGLKNAADKSALFLGSWRGQLFCFLNFVNLRSTLFLIQTVNHFVQSHKIKMISSIWSL